MYSIEFEHQKWSPCTISLEIIEYCGLFFEGSTNGNGYWSLYCISYLCEEVGLVSQSWSSDVGQAATQIEKLSCNICLFCRRRFIRWGNSCHCHYYYCSYYHWCCYFYHHCCCCCYSVDQKKYVTVNLVMPCIHEGIHKTVLRVHSVVSNCGTHGPC